MISKRFSKYLFLGLLAMLVAAPAVAYAADAAATTGGLTIGDGLKMLGSALAMGASALGAGWAQAKIGSAGQGVLAERPEERVFVLVLTALPETIVLLGFVMAIILKG
jgi:V/A-type H+-transporting ATPase subunit K